ncbi:MAG: DUF5916 domain-containing protein [Woeseiaceae bacterium]|nr:DUF5916 domain-containing protein [Woeseiaceae bacterium]
MISSAAHKSARNCLGHGPAVVLLSLLSCAAAAQEDIDAVEISLDAGSPLQLQRYDHDQAGIEIDGRLDEEAWRTVRVHSNLRVVEPDTLAVPVHETRIRLFYTDRGIYVSFDMDQPADTIIRRFTPRDGRDESRDFVSFTLDTSGGGRYGYWMSLALGDNQGDGTVLPERQFKRDWDGAWYGATSLTDTGWAAEYFIPWSQMAMPKEDRVRRMGFYGSRTVGYLNERWSWPALPNSLPRFMSALQPIELVGIDPRQQWSVFPYVSSTFDSVDDDTFWKAGTDIFWRPSTNFQLTATLNPDFGSAESDDVDVNLTANETFFPERRLFFLEGREVFDATPRASERQGGGGGNNVFTVINTRRIGGRPRRPDLPDGVGLTTRESLTVADLLGAVKATGQIGGFRYGVLAATEDDTNLRANNGERFIAHGRDFGALRVLYEDSEGAAYRGLGFVSTAVMHPDSDAMVHAGDFHYLSTNGRFNVDGQVIYSDDDDVGEEGYGAFADFTYTPRRGYKHTLQLAWFDENLEVNDFGFNQRNDLADLRYRFDWIRSGLKRVRNFRISPFIRYSENVTEGRQVSGAYAVSFETTLNNLHQVSGFAGLFPSRFEDRDSFGNGTYAIRQRGRFNVEYRTNEANELSFNTRISYQGEDVDGRELEYGAGLKWQPVSNFALELQANYQDRSGWLLHQEDRNFTQFVSERWQPELKLQYFPSAKQQFQLSLQWIGIRAEEDRFYTLPEDSLDLVEVPKPGTDDDSFSISQLNLQVRYRWQIAPLSDLFVVYQRGDRSRVSLADFDDLFSDSWSDPLGDTFLVKLRYRLGS